MGYNSDRYIIDENASEQTLIFVCPCLSINNFLRDEWHKVSLHLSFSIRLKTYCTNCQD